MSSLRSVPDNSKVWLNAASSLKYPSNFAALKERKVELTGEAYFEIAKDKVHPFIVQSGTQAVKVLGTHFNINSYADEPAIRTTLVEGSVSINDKTILKPDQQAIASSDGVKVISVNASVYINWKDGIFIFKNENLKSVMRKIARWYDVQVEYRGVEDKSKTYSGSVSKYTDISNVLKVLQDSEGINFTIEGKKLTVLLNN